MAHPQGPGPRYAQLFINTTSGQYVPLLAYGVPEDTGPLSLSATSLNWTIGGTTAGENYGTYQDVTLDNSGMTPVTIYGITEQDTGPTPGSTPDFVSTSNCGSSLAAQSSCTISVESTGYLNWVSTQSGYNENTFTGTLSIVDSASAWPQQVALSSANVETVSIPAFAYVQVGTTVAGTATANAGSEYEPTSANPTFAGADAADFTAPNGGCQENGSGGICTFEVDFKPSASGVRTAKMELGGGQYVLLTGNGLNAGPFFTATPSPLVIYEDVPSSPDPNGYFGSNTITITNYGTTTVAVSGTFTGANAAMMGIDLSKCTSVAPNATCTATVTVNTGTPGNYAATLTLKDTSSNFSTALPITAAVSYWTPAIVGVPNEFGDQAIGVASTALPFTVSDGNGYPLGHAVSVALPANSNFTLPQGTSCAASTTQVCSLSIAFDPHATGNISEILTATDTVTGLQSTAQLNGFGGTAIVSLSPTSLTFPELTNNTTSVPMSVTLTNTGIAALSVSSINVVGAVDANFTQTNNCVQLATNASCTIYVTFAPTATGPQSATIQMYSNAPSSPDSIAVSGTAD